MSIVCNLAFELFFVFDAFSIAAPENESLTADTLLSECETFIDALDECTERTYYRSAVNEIKLIERIVERAEISSNLLPREDLGRQTWVMANTGAFIPIINQIKRGCSFVLKYLAIDNFGVSSGERALLNYMSRLYFASQINDFIPNSGFVWNESVLLLIDEIDLYLHPEWQRQILNDFLTAIQEYFPHSYFQIIITSHSPIVLSDIPHENSIFLRKDGDKIVQDKMNAAETFLDGGTDFERPLDEAIQLMDTGFENADIVFLTDGLCELPEDYLAKLHKAQAARKFTVTGILLDAGNPGMAFSLTPFCQKIYRTSELAGDEIVRGLVSQRM